MSDPSFAALLITNYETLVGRPLAENSDGVKPTAAWLYNDAPFCLLAHNNAPDPHFIYANRAAQDCFGYSWQEFLQLPSRLSAEAPEQAERQRLLNAVKHSGFIDGYSGIRIAKSGHRFRIENATVWELLDDQNTRLGQAALFYPPSITSG